MSDLVSCSMTFSVFPQNPNLWVMGELYMSQKRKMKKISSKPPNVNLREWLLGLQKIPLALQNPWQMLKSVPKSKKKNISKDCLEMPKNSLDVLINIPFI